MLEAEVQESLRAPIRFGGVHTVWLEPGEEPPCPEYSAELEALVAKARMILTRLEEVCASLL